MAAILPHLEVPFETTDLERAYIECTSPLSGAGLGDGHPSCPTPNEVLRASHDEIMKMTYLRAGVEESLKGRSFRVQMGTASGSQKRRAFIVLDAPAGLGPVWSPTTADNLRNFGLLSWTSKMNTPSWSLPAGSPNTGGSCPGALAAQTIVPETERKKTEKRVVAIMQRTLPLYENLDLAKSVCQHCYAGGGQYSTGNVQFAQVLRFMWARQALSMVVPSAADGSLSNAFIETMVYVIEHADYMLDGGTIKKDPETGEEAQKLSPEPTGKRFFRLHDSGDFFASNYYAAWLQIIARLPDITFWAPTRVWATKWGDTLDGTTIPPNLVLRPSAFDVGAPPPQLTHQGYAAGTTVIAFKDNPGMSRAKEEHVARYENHAPRTGGPDTRYDWDCRAYAVDKGPTCRDAVAPPGEGGPDGRGCRACWKLTDQVINYTLH